MSRDTDVFGKMDPYIMMTLGSQKKTTKAKNNEGKSCVWAQRVQIEIKDAAKAKFHIKVFDKDPMIDDLVGETEIEMLKENMLLPSEKPKEKSFDLYYKK